jgi:methionine synthase II (cobalamin-independent)
MSSVHIKAPFRADHVGSLLRPKTLYEKRQAYQSNQCPYSTLKPVEDDAIGHVLKLQQDTGIKSFTDGELRRFVLVFHFVL